MTRRVSRRTFLAATATVVSAVACRELAPTPKEARRPVPPTPVPATDVPPVVPTPTTTAVVKQVPDGYVAVAPRVLRSGQVEIVILCTH